MAWLNRKRRKNPETGRVAVYYALAWREGGRATVRTRAIGFCGAKDANQALKVLEGRLASGAPPMPSAPGSSPAPPPTTTSLADYLDQVFLPVVQRDKAPKTYETMRGSANNLKRLLGHLHLDEVTFAGADAYVTARKEEGRRTRTIILELRCLKQCLAHAVACEVLPFAPQLPTLKDRDRKPHRFLSPDQSVRLLAALKPFAVQPHVVTRVRPPIPRDRLTYLAVLMALNTGMRRNEILTRTWSDVRWDQGRLGALLVGAKPNAGFRVKMDRERAIPLTPELREALAEAHLAAGRPFDDWVFPSPRDSTKPRATFAKALARACERAGVPRVHIHGLRHTWASRLAMAGVPRRTLMELGGWKEGRMLDEIYAHATDAHKEDVMAQMGLGAPDNGSPTTFDDLLDKRARQ